MKIKQSAKTSVKVIYVNICEIIWKYERKNSKAS